MIPPLGSGDIEGGPQGLSTLTWVMIGLGSAVGVAAVGAIVFLLTKKRQI